MFHRAAALVPSTQLWEPLPHEHEGKSEKACCLSGLLLSLFMFLLPWYPWQSYEQRAYFGRTAVPSLLPAAHPDHGYPWNKPHAVRFCSVQPSTRFQCVLSLFSPRTATAECPTAGRVGSIGCWVGSCECHSRCSLSGLSLTSAARRVSHRHGGKKEDENCIFCTLVTGTFFCFFGDSTTNPNERAADRETYNDVFIYNYGV